MHIVLIIQFLSRFHTLQLQMLSRLHVCSAIARQGSCPHLTGLVNRITLPLSWLISRLQCTDSIMLSDQTGF